MEQEDDTKVRLIGLTNIIDKVYLPLMEGRQDTRISMEKFVRTVRISMQQAYGNITIKVPDLPENASTEQLCNNKEIIEELTATVEQWA
jgi:hypothetical protein